MKKQIQKVTLKTRELTTAEHEAVTGGDISLVSLPSGPRPGPGPGGTGALTASFAFYVPRYF